MSHNSPLLSELKAKVRANPNNINAWMELGQMLHALAQYEKAEDCYEYVLKLNPRQPDLLKTLGRIRHQLEQEKQYALERRRERVTLFLVVGGFFLVLLGTIALSTKAAGVDLMSRPQMLLGLLFAILLTAGLVLNHFVSEYLEKLILEWLNKHLDWGIYIGYRETWKVRNYKGFTKGVLEIWLLGLRMLIFVFEMVFILLPGFCFLMYVMSYFLNF